MAAIVGGVGAWLADGRVAGAAPRHVTVAVCDGTGGPRAGVTVHFYEGGQGKCACVNNTCQIAPDATSDPTGKNGRVKKNLKANTSYVACVDDRCDGVCQPAPNCQFRGSCSVPFTTNAAGGSSNLVSINC